MDRQTGRSLVSIVTHVVIWSLLGFVILFYPPLTWNIRVPHGFWLKQAFNLLLYVAAFYLNIHHAAPKLLFRKNKWPFFLWVFGVGILLLTVARIVEVQLGVLDEMARMNGKPAKSVFTIDVHLLMSYMVVIGASTSMAMSRRWHADLHLHEIREKQQIVSELALLKAQINPHFFFNTLNNIYALTFSDVDVSRESILKLSRMMRYVLYDTLNDSAMLSQEIAFLNDYIALMRLRLHALTALKVSIAVPANDYPIAPMLLLPFIENAFKHGTSALQEAAIDIAVRLEADELHMRVFNRIQGERDQYRFEQGGIGLVNTRKRLNLLYPGAHSLRIDVDECERTYEVLLTIRLSAIPEQHITPLHEAELHNR